MGVETAILPTRHGIGQSSYIAIGGDLMIGTGYDDSLSQGGRVGVRA